MKQNELITTLQGISFLTNIDRAHLEQIATIAEIREFDIHDIVFREGEAAEYVYLVVTGKLMLELCPSTIYQKSLMSVGPGEMLGWSSFVEHRYFAATAVVVAPTKLVRIDGKRLRAICDRDTEFGYEFMRRVMQGLAKRLTATWTQLANVYVPGNLPVTMGAGE
jgi:CRP/FNR family transcriptional regulator, cyclic AMP receptor protein